MAEIMMSEQNRNSSSPSHITQPHAEAEAEAEDKFETLSQELEYLRYDVKKDKSNIRNALLTVAVLIGTATYQAAVNPPGGVWQDDNSTTTPKHIAGASVWVSKHPVTFGLFMFGNTAGFSFAFSMIEYLTRGCLLATHLNMCMLAIGFTYGLNLNSLVPTDYMPNPYSLTITFLSIFLPYIIRLLNPKLYMSSKTQQTAPPLP